MLQEEVAHDTLDMRVSLLTDSTFPVLMPQEEASAKEDVLLPLNPYPALGAPELPCWPRGFPVSYIKNERTHRFSLKRVRMRSSE